MSKILFISLILLLVPAVAYATDSYDACNNIVGGSCSGSSEVYYDGIVPCGKDLCCGGMVDGNCTGGSVEVPCQFCHVLIMFNRIVNFFLLPPTGLVWVVALLMVVVAGVLYMISYGFTWNPGMIQTANRILSSTFLGLIIALGSWIVINTFFLVLGVEDWTGLKPDGEEGWFSINCPVELAPVGEQEATSTCN